MNALATHVRPELPNNLAAEQALLGALLINNDAYQAVASFLKAEHFSEPLHSMLFGLAVSPIGQGKVANPVTLRAFLAAEEKVGELTLYQYVVRLAAEAMPPIGVRDYGLAIVDAAERRQLVSLAEELMQDAYAQMPDRPAVAIASDFESKLAELRTESPKAQASGTARAVVERLHRRISAKEQSSTVSLPLSEMTEVLGGELEAGNLYGLLSSSGEGKTSLALQVAFRAARAGSPVLVLSYDQSPEQCVDQIASQIAGIELARIKRRTLMEQEWNAYFDALTILQALPLAVEHCSREGTSQLGSHARRFVKRTSGSRPALVVLDHVRRVAPRDPKAHEGRIASEVNSTCKALAGELGVAWLSLNQRSSFGMRRENPRPISSDIFGGEQAKEDYDAMLYLYRPAKYQEDQLRTARDGKDKQRILERFAEFPPDQAEIGALKVRYGDPMARRRLLFEKEFTRYVSLRAEQPPALEGTFN